MTDLTIRVVNAIPAPQGSKKFAGMRGGHAVLVESSKKVTPWRAAVETAAKNAMLANTWTTLDGPIVVDMLFWLPAPARMPKGRTHPTTYPDVSKLARSTEDALVTAGVIVDDARIVREHLAKDYVKPGQPPGAVIVIRALATEGMMST